MRLRAEIADKRRVLEYQIRYVERMILNDTSRYLNLGDWIKYDSYAVFDGNNMFLNYYKAI